MAFQASYFLAIVLISNILLIATTVSGRSIGKNSNTQDKKEPQFLFKHDGRVYVPGIGPVRFPPKFHLTPQNPFPGGNGGAGTGAGTEIGSRPGSGSGSGSGSTGHNFVPGGDDTFVPNPGYEVPFPGNGGSVPAPDQP